MAQITSLLICIPADAFLTTRSLLHFTVLSVLVRTS